MKIGILGSGSVGQTVGSALIERGHEVKIGSRSPQKLAEWQQGAGSRASTGSFADAAAFGEVLFNCTLGSASIEALTAAGEAHLNGKILIDISNPLDFSNGMPPTLFVCNDDSLGEQIQRAFPAVRVVKTLNTLTAVLMVKPALLPEDHNIFLSGSDSTAKAEVVRLLEEWFGWKASNIIDLGDITTARGTEMLLPIWIRLWGTLQTDIFNFKIVR